MCKKCHEEPVYEFSNKRKVCKKCFLYWFNKKFLYIIRKYQLIKNGDDLFYLDKKDFRSVVLKKLLLDFSDRLRVKLYETNRFNYKKSKKVKFVLDDSADIISKSFIENLLIAKDIKTDEFLPFYQNKIRPLFLFLDKEIKLYALLNKLDFDNINEKSDKITNYIDELELKHLEIKNSILSSYLKLFN